MSDEVDLYDPDELARRKRRQRERDARALQRGELSERDLQDANGLFAHSGRARIRFDAAKSPE